MRYIGGNGGQGFALNGVQIDGHDPAVFRQRVCGDVCPDDSVNGLRAQNLNLRARFQHGNSRSIERGFAAYIQRNANSGGDFCSCGQRLLRIVLRLRCLHRVGEQSGSKGNTQQGCQRNHPEFGLAVVQHPGNALLYPHLRKCQGANLNPIGGGAGQQSGGVILLLLGVHAFNHGFVTGLLHIPAEQEVGNPAQGIEPVNAQQHIAQGLPQVVAPAQVGLLVSQHGDSGSFVQIRGQEYFGVHDAQDEGGADGVAAVHPLPGGGGKPHLPEKAEVADGGIQQHGCNAQPPRQGNQTCRRECRRGSFCGGEGIGSEGSGADPIHLPGVQGLGNLLGSGSGLGHHAHPALKGEGERQPNGNQPPQQTGKAAGCLFQQRAQRQQNENHPPGGETQPDNLPKEGKTHKGFSFPYSSSIRRMSLTSWGESFFPEAKAEIKAGREPWKVSSTNRWLCRA